MGVSLLECALSEAPLGGAHLHAFDALEANGVSLGLCQCGLCIWDLGWRFLGGTHIAA